VIERFYLKLFQEHKWGYSLGSLLGGTVNIHPYYVDELFKKQSYTIEEIWNVLTYIKEKCPISFSGEKLQNALEERYYVPPSPEQATEIVKKIESEIKVFPADDAFSLSELKIKNRHKDKKFLIIATGPSTLTYEKKIKEFADKNGLITIGCNYLKNIYKPNYHIFVSKKRFLKYISTVNEKSTLIVPAFFGKKLIADNYSRNYEYIEIKSAQNIDSKVIDGISQQTVFLNVAVAAILTAYQMGAEEIMVAGMDGYEDEMNKKIIYFYNEDDTPADKSIASLRYDELAIELQRVSKYLQAEGVPFSIITPTTHKKYYHKLIS